MPENQERNPKFGTTSELPPGVKLLRTFDGHQDVVNSVAFDLQGEMLASGSDDSTVKLWEARSGKLLRTLEGHRGKVWSVAFNPKGETLASASQDKTVKLWEVQSGKLLRTLVGHHAAMNTVTFDPQGEMLAGSMNGVLMIWEVQSGRLLRTLDGHMSSGVAFDPQGETLASGSHDGAVRLWNVRSGELLRALDGHDYAVYGVAFKPQGNTLASGSGDKTIKLWEARSGKLLRTLEGHTGIVDIVAFSPDGRLLASKSNDDTIRLWNCETWETVGVIPVQKKEPRDWIPALAFHPTLPLLATAGSEPDTPASKRSRLIRLWELDSVLLLGHSAQQGAHYVNAKVVLVGDTGVGKSGLSLVLNNQQFQATESTPGRRVWTLDSREVHVGDNFMQTRETLLWDLAGQPGYRVIHQLHLNEVAVALVVFDARSETDPLAGVRHWERALRLAQQRQRVSAVPMKKFLVSARNDRGGVSIGEDRLQAILKEFGFDGYFKTSAKEGWEIKELRAAIEQAVDWERLPEVSSSELFADIKSFLLDVKKTGRLLAPASQLYDEFAREHPDNAAQETNLRDQFDTCIGRLENRDLIRRLTFGGYVLLQPELLDAYGSAMVNTAKEEPDGLGSLAEEIALAGKFFVPKEQKIADPGQEQLLLHATVEELVQHDLALRENADDGRYLVFPSQFNRDYEDAPEPKGKAVAITFDGPAQSLYSTLAVRLGHSGLFTTGRAEMWRNAAVFAARTGGKCGLFLHEFAEARGRLILFFPDEHSSAETRYHFEEFVVAHAKRRALDGTVELVRFFVCPDCGDPVPDNYVKRLREKGKTEFNCPCGGMVSLAEPKERIHFPSKVEAMDKSADRQRDFDAFVLSAKGETSTKSFQEWAGGEQVTLAIVFTDVVASTALGEEIRDEAMNLTRRDHFSHSRKLIGQFKGREIKTIGDSFMAAFRCVGDALDYARALQANTGHPLVHVRAGIHIGPMHVEEGDVFGGTVNFAARVVGAVTDAEIWLSDRAKEDIDRLGAAKHKHLNWQRHEGVAMKGFSGEFALWALTR
jgi:WD40 repeat protein/class 3 adenylate cyclase